MRNARIPRDVVVQTIFGEEIRQQKCRICKIEKPIFEFYCKSDSYEAREDCKKCWKMFNGNFKSSKSFSEYIRKYGEK